MAQDFDRNRAARMRQLLNESDQSRQVAIAHCLVSIADAAHRMFQLSQLRAQGALSDDAAETLSWLEKEIDKVFVGQLGISLVEAIKNGVKNGQ